MVKNIKIHFNVSEKIKKFNIRDIIQKNFTNFKKFMRPIIGILISQTEPNNERLNRIAHSLGDAIVSSGFRIVSNAYKGLSEALFTGGMNSENYFEGSIICISNNKAPNNYICDIFLPTDENNNTKLFVNMSNAIIALDGEDEIIAALQYAFKKNKPIIFFKDYCKWLNDFYNNTFSIKQKDLLFPVSDIDEIIDILLKTT